MAQGIKILSLDGGGIRGVSALLILEAIMENLRETDGLEETPRPCDYFDLIGGTSTGGIIAIMLGRLRMSVDECLRAYKILAGNAFTRKKDSFFHLPARPTGAFSATALEEAIKTVVVEQCIKGVCNSGNCSAADLPLRDETCCKTVVLAITKGNVRAMPTLFKSYDKTPSLKDCAIWEVARATSAATTFFKSIKCGRDGIEFIDAGFGFNNPCECLLQEARAVFPNTAFRSIVSIGTGLAGVVSISDNRKSILDALKTMASSSQQVADRLDAKYSESDIYFRFNVPQGLEDIALADWKETSTIAAHTSNYIAAQGRYISKCSKSLRREVAPPNSRELILARDSNTIIKPTPRKNEHFDVPFDKNKNYVERPNITNQLEHFFGIHKSTVSFQAQRVVLHGLGGSGKTESAVHFAECHRQVYSAVFWVHGADEARLHEGFEKIGRTVFNGEKGHSVDYVNQAQIWFTNNDEWLLIADNVDDELALDGLRRKYLKGGMEGHVLVTSRNPMASTHWDGVEIADMKQSEAITLLSNITGQDCGRKDRVLTDLLADLGHLPLAIDQASSYIAATEISIKEYYDWFQLEKARLLRQLPSTQYNYDSRETVMTTWEISFKHIERVNMPASQLLLMIPVFSPDDIPIDMLELTNDKLHHWASNGEFEPLPEDQEWVSTTMKQILQSPLRLREALLALKNFSFLRYKSGGKSFQVHPLVHYWASQRLELHPIRQSLTICSIGLVASSFGKEERMPPFALPYGSRDIASVLEEKSLRLWPWRQYKQLAPHAHHCMPYIVRLDTLPESMVHLSLSLLQVLDYFSADSEPGEPFKVHRDYAHDIIDVAAKFRGASNFRVAANFRGAPDFRGAANFRGASDCFLYLSIVLWRLARAVVCACQKDSNICDRRCYKCKNASEDAAHFLSSLETLQDALSTARVRAASLGLLMVLSLGGARLQRYSPFSDSFRTRAEETSAYVSAMEQLNLSFMLAKAPFNEWFGNPDSLQSYMEKYIYNFYRYLQIRSSSQSKTPPIDPELAENVSQSYGRMCGRNSEEYRRSVWYLTTSLQDRQNWSQVEDYLKPLVMYSIKCPIDSWSHERCIIRLVNALVNMRKEDEAQRIMMSVQKAYTDAGKMLRSTRQNPLLTSWYEHKSTGEEPWQIFIKTLSATTITVASHPLATVSSLYDVVHEREGHPLYVMRFIYGGKQLDRDRFLSDYDIQRGCTIHLVLRMSGGAFTET